MKAELEIWLVNVRDSMGKRTEKFSAKFSKVLKQLKHTVEHNVMPKLTSAKFLGRARWPEAMLKFITNSGTSALRTARSWASLIRNGTRYKFRLRSDLGSPTPEE